jgi:hypothetical protein
MEGTDLLMSHGALSHLHLLLLRRDTLGPRTIYSRAVRSTPDSLEESLDVHLQARQHSGVQWSLQTAESLPGLLLLARSVLGVFFRSTTAPNSSQLYPSQSKNHWSSSKALPEDKKDRASLPFEEEIETEVSWLEKGHIWVRCRAWTWIRFSEFKPCTISNNRY